MKYSKRKEVKMKKCQYCGSRDNLTVDHKQPEIKGGTDDIKNLQCLCKSCNIIKGDIPHGRLLSLARWFAKTKRFQKEMNREMKKSPVDN